MCLKSLKWEDWAGVTVVLSTSFRIGQEYNIYFHVNL